MVHNFLSAVWPFTTILAKYRDFKLNNHIKHANATQCKEENPFQNSRQIYIVSTIMAAMLQNRNDNITKQGKHRGIGR